MRLLLTDGSIDVLNHLAKELGDFFEICTCSDGEELMEYVETFRPEIMVLDLAMQGYDPLAFLTAVRHKNIPVFATCFFTSEYIEQCLDELGVCWLVRKPLSGKVVAGRLLKMSMDLKPPPDYRVRNTVHNMLMELGVRMSQKVFRLLTEGVIFEVFNANCAILDELYPHVAQQCNTSATSVEVTIRRGIAQAYRYRDVYSWKCIFGQELKRKPTNGRFIKHLASLVREDLQMEK